LTLFDSSNNYVSSVALASDNIPRATRYDASITRGEERRGEERRGEERRGEERRGEGRRADCLFKSGWRDGFKWIVTKYKWHFTFRYIFLMAVHKY
jgi:hypothetical protein